MFSHIFVGVSQFDRALHFYGALMDALGIRQRFCDRDKPWAGWHSEGGQRPLFVIAHPADGQLPQAGNGQMVAFAANTRGQVDEVHRLALSMGGTDEGAPGLRLHYHANYYGAYFRDLDGNKLCVVCNQAEQP
ncbi:glyoxalase [Hydrogenophaga crassostreae]|uniref:Glyoxalase n=1 Tax=Hydrogenophaga crassostreae TaxID=1763535 RepID=A0A162YRF1_9BURK|nr:VOC family protein [Hydrogenophaga crassostreae]AOW14823.1 glyoxalase [Hydrogenophaga crassostreae]OAD39652.1 glyoxalase [Hydrogenophaga crassostreae]